MTTDHYAEAALALTDAVRALKAGATVTTTHVEVPDLRQDAMREFLHEFGRRIAAAEREAEEAPRG